MTEKSLPSLYSLLSEPIEPWGIEAAKDVWQLVILWKCLSYG